MTLKWYYILWLLNNLIVLILYWLKSIYMWHCGYVKIFPFRKYLAKLEFMRKCFLYWNYRNLLRDNIKILDINLGKCLFKRRDWIMKYIMNRKKMFIYIINIQWYKHPWDIFTWGYQCEEDTFCPHVKTVMGSQYLACSNSCLPVTYGNRLSMLA